MTHEFSSPHRSPHRAHERKFFYKYLKAKDVKIILGTRKLRWSSPLLFNDRFDVRQELPLNFNAAQLSAAHTEEVASLIEQGGSLSSVVNHPELAVILNAMGKASPEKRKKMAHLLRQNSGKTTDGQIDALAEIKNKWRDIIPNFRILCLSELNDVTSMWWHYANKNKGVVLEFESVDEIDSCFLMARPVIYQDSPPAIADAKSWARCIIGQKQSDFVKLFTEYQYIKTKDWAYEREWRIVSPGTRPGETGLFSDYPFHSSELNSIYFGSKCPPEDKTDILSLLTHGLDHVSNYEAVADEQKAKFTFRQITQ